MRSTTMIWITLLLLSGCLSKEENTNLNAIDIPTIRDCSGLIKNEVSLKMTFIDERTGDIVAEINLAELGYSEESLSLDQTKVEEFARSLAKNIDQPLINPTINRSGEITSGQKRVILSEKELVENIMLLHYFNKENILPIYETLPVVTEEDLKTIKESLISHYTTYFDASVEGRATNVKLSSQAFDHTVIGPGETLSFNKVVGQRTRERGYQEAIEIVNKQFVKGIGGGICQTSSTLFNAVDLAGMEIVERHSHSREIGYVPVSRDATVSWGGPDFKFRNPYDFPLLISASTSIEDGKIQIQIYGSKRAEEYIHSIH